MAEMKKTSFVMAMREFFGFKEGQTLSQFSEELKALTPEDRAFFARELKTVGYEVPVA